MKTLLAVLYVIACLFITAKVISFITIDEEDINMMARVNGAFTLGVLILTFCTGVEVGQWQYKRKDK